MISPEGAFNFRDMFAGVPGVRQGALYRSDDPTRLTPEGRRTVDGLCLAMVVDLRQEAQAQRPQRYADDARTVNLPLVDQVIDHDAPPPMEDAADLANLYEGMLARSQERLGEVLDLVADSLEVGPVLVHCAYGKDRAGLVSALLQATMGLDRAAIVEDYGRSDEPSRRRRAAQVADPLADDPDLSRVPPNLFTAPAEAMDILLGRVLEQHSTLTDWAASIPASPGTLDRIRSHLHVG